jgi:molybdopterin synthase catalytic subunit
MGQIFVQVTDQPIPTVLPAASYSPLQSHGGEVTFRGLIRDFNQGRQVVALSYDSFAPLAEATLREIAQEAQAQWGQDLCITAIHRTGRLELGDCAVVVSVSAPHRYEAYMASQHVIENLKTRAAIWKKEHYVDGDSQWLQGHALCQHAKTERGHDHGSHASRHAHS